MNTKKQIVVISNLDNMTYFFSTDHCQKHNLGDSYVPCTHTIPSRCEPREILPDGIIKDRKDLVNIFYDDMTEIENPDSKFKIPLSEYRPSDFTEQPWSSVLNQSEYETIALNIMKVLARTGNVFRPLDWEEYKSERLKDRNFSEREKSYFDKSINYCTSAEVAVTFSKSWRK